MFDWIIIRICNDGSLIARFSYRQQKIIMRIREVVMKLTEFLREELDREVERSRKALDETAAAARTALEKTTDEHLRTNWKLLAGGKVVIEEPRYVMIQETINHWAHHRGQMTVYLRLMGQK